MFYLLIFHGNRYCDVTKVYGPIDADEVNRIITEEDAQIWVSIPV